MVDILHIYSTYILHILCVTSSLAGGSGDAPYDLAFKRAGAVKPLHGTSVIYAEQV